MRNAGLIVIVLILMFLLRPKFFVNMFGGSSEEEYTEYAEGYGPDDFKDFEYPSEDPGQFVSEQKPISGLWTTLFKVTFDTQFDEETEAVVFNPLFSDEVKALDGKEIEIEGYIVPLEVKDDRFMLSAYPFSSCFFCGNAGPESVIEVFPKTPIEMTTQSIILKGKFELNYNDRLHMPYILKEASDEF